MSHRTPNEWLRQMVEDGYNLAAASLDPRLNGAGLWC